MMKRQILFIVASLAVGFTADAQDLPKNPEPGHCYVRCTTPDVYTNETVELNLE